MKIVLAGQLNRVYSNALSYHAPKSGGARFGDHGKARQVGDRPLIQRALSLAALSCSIVTSSDANMGQDDELLDRQRGQDPHFAPGMSLTPSLWADLYDDAASLVKAVDFLGTYSEPSLAVMDAIAASGAWIDDDGSCSHRRSKMGTTHAYLADLLLQAFLAWQARAILVMCEADCHVLADIAKFLVEGNRPRPFPIPDLRAFVQRDGQHASSNLPNLGLECLADVETARRDSSVQALARQLQVVDEAPGSFQHGEVVPITLTNASSPRTRLQRSEDFAIIIEDAKVLSNEGVPVAMHKKAFVRMSLRTFADSDVRLLIMRG